MTNPMTMVEKVARAICIRAGNDPGPSKLHDGHSLTEVPTWTIFVTHALAAIAAMREPTEAMIEAAVMPEYGDDLPRTKGGHPTVGGMATAHWQAMIDTVLSEGEK